MALHAPAATSTTLTLVAIVPLLVWRVVARVRRQIGRQRLSRARPWITLTVFPLLLAWLGFAAAAGAPARLGWMLGGVVAGAALGRLGWRHTKREATPQGLYYTPNLHLGILVSMLFVGRVAFRLVELYGTPPDAVPAFASSRSTLAVFGLLAAYYVVYAASLVRWRLRVRRGADARRDRAASSASGSPPPAGDA
jgi:hypothetical protein